MIKAKKHLGQNFLKNIHILENIVGWDSLWDTDIVEIGPWPGDLTAQILKKNPRSLHVIELDKDMLPILKDRFWDAIFIHHWDILETNITQKKWDIWIYLPNNYRVYGNIPYYITSPIIMHFLYSVSHTPQSITITMQKEVADRILAHNKKYCVLSLACQLMSHVEKVCDIHPNNFSPVPKVWSSCLRFTNISHDKENNRKILSLIKQGFSQKRKKLFSNLTHAWYVRDSVLAAFDTFHLDQNIRPEDVSVEQWKLLSNTLIRF